MPTTVYRTGRDLSRATPADLHDLRPGTSHPPLAVMLVLTQAAVGTYLVDLWVNALRLRPPETSVVTASLALAVAVVALGGSLLHLGRPQYAYRAVIGLRHSWLSREIVAFGAFAAHAAGYAVAVLTGAEHLLLSIGLPTAAAVAGVAGVGCSAMIYAVTGRRWWRLRSLGLRFALTTLRGGLAVLLVALAWEAWLTGAEVEAAMRGLALVLVGATAVGLFGEVAVLRHVGGPAQDGLARTARLLLGPLRAGTMARGGLGAVGGIALPLLLAWVVMHPAADPTAAVLVAFLGALVLLAGELVERWLMFTASSPRRMPGGLH